MRKHTGEILSKDPAFFPADEVVETRRAENDSRDSVSKSSTSSRPSASGRPPLPPSNHKFDNSVQNINHIQCSGRSGTASAVVTNVPTNVTPAQHSHQPQQLHQQQSAQFNPQHQQRSSTNSSPECKLDLPDLFSSYGLGKYTDLFQQQEVRERYDLQGCIKL